MRFTSVGAVSIPRRVTESAASRYGKRGYIYLKRTQKEKSDVKLKHKLFSGYLTIVGMALFLCVLSLNGYRTIHTHFMATTQDILPGQQAMMNAKQCEQWLKYDVKTFLGSF